MDKLKYIKLENEDGSYSDSIPLSVDANHIDVESREENISLSNYIESNDTDIDNIHNTNTNLQTQINNHTTSIKANTSAINTQKTRIDNLAHLSEGSTTGDAELIDARIGFDNTTYTSVGDAIRDQVSGIYDNFAANILIDISGDQVLQNPPIDIVENNDGTTTVSIKPYCFRGIRSNTWKQGATSTASFVRSELRNTTYWLTFKNNGTINLVDPNNVNDIDKLGAGGTGILCWIWFTAQGTIETIFATEAIKGLIRLNGEPVSNNGYVPNFVLGNLEPSAYVNISTTEKKLTMVNGGYLAHTRGYVGISGIKELDLTSVFDGNASTKAIWYDLKTGTLSYTDCFSSVLSHHYGQYKALLAIIYFRTKGALRLLSMAPSYFRINEKPNFSWNESREFNWLQGMSKADCLDININTTGEYPTLERLGTASTGVYPLWGKYRFIGKPSDIVFNPDINLDNNNNATWVYYLDTANRIQGCPSDSASSIISKDHIVLFMMWWSSSKQAPSGIIPAPCLRNSFYKNGEKIDIPDWGATTPSIIINNNTPTDYTISDIGHINKQDIGNTDYSHIILYGQSLSMGWEAPEVITTTPVDNCYMVGSSPMINHGNDESLTLNPLVAVKWSSGGEQPIVALTNSFATLYNDNHSVPQKFIGTNCGEGGRSIERLMKQCTNGTNYYTTEFLDCINSAKSAVDALDKTISCPAIFYMQGEYNYVQTTDAGLTPGTDATTDKDQYKAYLLQLKNDMQADIMAKYGQTKKPLFFVYQVAGRYINRTDMSITMAQIEFAQENEDVFLMNSTYGMPDYGGGHLSTNGYRWYGEMMAKSLYQVLENRKQWNGLELANIQIDEKNVLCDFRAPVLPLVFDNWTKDTCANNGFRIFKNDTEVAIIDMTIINNRVVLLTNTDLTTGTIEITYAGQGPNGSGNLRDSDEFNSMYTYYDDRESAPSKRENYTPKDKNGNFIYGKKYPMYNWANHFYKKIINN